MLREITMDGGSAGEAHLCPTAILDYRSPGLQAVLERLEGSAATPLGLLQAAHRLLSTQIAPTYTVDELQPASATLAKGKGSCSQRFACLESLARGLGIPTRARGLWIAGKFWAPRFPIARIFIPRRILLIWPQFHLDGRWLSVENLFGSLESLAQRNPAAFANDGESLFEAISNSAVDFGGCTDGRCDLSRFAVGNGGIFDSRDELLAAHPLFQKTLRGRAFEMIFGGRKSS